MRARMEAGSGERSAAGGGGAGGSSSDGGPSAPDDGEREAERARRALRGARAVRLPVGLTAVNEARAGGSRRR